MKELNMLYVQNVRVGDWVDEKGTVKISKIEKNGNSYRLFYSNGVIMDREQGESVVVFR